MVAKKIGPDDYQRLFASLRSLVDQTEAAYLSGNLPLARHATANLSFATNLIHSSLRQEESAGVSSNI
jgi:hypothetical protein